MPRREKSGVLTQNEQIDIMWDALAGDMTMVISPTTLVSTPLSTAWTRNVVITIVDSDSETHSWINQAFTTSLAIGDTSTAGTASIVATTLTLVNGTATIVVSGDAQDWLNTETDTLTVSALSILGYSVTGGTSVETFTT